MAGKRIAAVARARLLKAIGEGPRLVLARAPAGFGKSMLLEQLEADLRLRHLPLCSAGLRDGRGVSGFGQAIAGATDKAEGWVLIDDADRLADHPQLAVLVGQLAASADGPRLVLTGRGDCGLPLARHRADGTLLEIGPRELLFDADEQRQAFENWAEHRILARQAEAMAAAIGGWPCGFGLQHLGLGQLAERGPARAIKGDWHIVADYFEQEVLAALPADVQNFLRRASVLEHLCVADCDLVLEGTEARAMLRQAHALGAPLWPVDAEHLEYEVLPLFRQFLHAGLVSDEAARLRARAMEAFETAGRFREASALALDLGDHAAAAGLLERQYRADFALRDDGRLLPLAERIKSGVRDRHPHILLALAQAHVFRFEFEKARIKLDRVRQLIAEPGAASDPAELQSLEMLLLHHEMVLALGQHELSRAQELGDRLLRNIEDVPPMQRVMILNSLSFAQQELYIFRGAERYYVQAKKLIPELDSWISSIPLETFYARHLFQTGRTASAIQLLEDTLARLVEELGPRPVLGAIAGVTLAEMKFETDELAEAAQLLADYGADVERFGFLPMTIAARTIQARVHMAQGEHDKGFAVLERPFVGAGELFDEMFRSLTVERIYWLLRLGRMEAAKLACGTIGLSLARPPEPHSSAAAAEEAFATAWIQLARANKRIDEAIHLAQKWQRYTEGVGAIRSNVRWNVILASLQVLAEEPSLAMRHLRRAVLLGAGGLHRSAFLAEADVLQEHYARLVGSDLNELERDFLSSILKDPRLAAPATDQADIAVPLGAFSSREAAILRLVAKGMLNREIGGALGMTEGTVKWYLQRIYDKLGIRRRSQVAMLVSQWHAQGVSQEALH